MVEKGMTHLILTNQFFDGALNYLHPFVFTRNASNENFTLSSMLKEYVVPQFVASLQKKGNDDK